MQKEFLIQGDEAVRAVDFVVETVRKAVVSTMGPNGKVALISNGAVATKTTKDGVTVARSIKFDDEFKELINRVITEPALKTERDCGDGTTTTIHLTAELLGIYRQQKTFSQRKRFEEMVGHIVDKLTENAIQVTVDDPRLYQVALTSSNQDEELARTVTDIYKQAGVDSVEIDLKEGQTFDDKVQKEQGRALRLSYSYPIYGGNGVGGQMTLKCFTPVVVDDQITHIDQAVVAKGIVDYMAASGNHWPLVIVARSVEQDPNNKLLGIIQLIRQEINKGNVGISPEGVEFLQSQEIVLMQTGSGGGVGSADIKDMSVLLGAPLLHTLEEIGTVSCKRFPGESTLVTNSARSILVGTSDEVEKRVQDHIAEIKQLVAQYSMTDMYSVRGRLTVNRIRRLEGKMVTIHVGGETNSEIKERIDRYDDVVKAVKSAIENGILPGGGTALMRAVTEVLEENLDTPEELRVLLLEMAVSGHLKLFGDLGVLPDTDVLYSPAYMKSGLIMNLATDGMGTAEELGVYDTAFASITALKGGLQTAKLLDGTRALITGGKLNQVAVQRL